ncbi:DUF2785 domain-containing protein [Halobacillus salinus]|uniref:DUF2785 domain-containing protein n=1 Tax=Halobacillus salinus TaxID=192814 RepID=A0A4Z0GUW9_9BACI|nr:DUF2785 domain-containing protein [Halobacillus salinus]TGB01027.1 DUF2785 domain-containing protein [Halobacillus salinus]
MNETELKNLLAAQHQGGNWANVDTLSMIAHIGSTDPELRDELIYRGFVKMIIHQDQLSSTTLEELLTICLDDLLMKGIGEKNTDSVFTRAFTTLLMTLIVYRDNEDNFLPASKVTTTKEHVIRYINEEQDLRGYVLQKGWAHSVAHVADLVDELAKNPKVDTEDHRNLLLPLWNKVLTGDSVYLHDEDERILIPTMEMLDRGLDSHILENWISELPDYFKKQQLPPEKYWVLQANAKKFLKSFHLELSRTSTFPSLQKSIENSLDTI